MRLSEERVCSFWKNGYLVVEGILDDQKLDAAGSPLNGFMFEEARRIAGDSIRPLVTWDESPDITKLSDRVIHLQFHIKERGCIRLLLSTNPNPDGRTAPAPYRAVPG